MSTRALANACRHRRLCAWCVFTDAAASRRRRVRVSSRISRIMHASVFHATQLLSYDVRMHAYTCMCSVYLGNKSSSAGWSMNPKRLVLCERSFLYNFWLFFFFTCFTIYYILFEWILRVWVWPSRLFGRNNGRTRKIGDICNLLDRNEILWWFPSSIKAECTRSACRMRMKRALYQRGI